MSNPERVAFPWPRLSRPLDVVGWAAQLTDALTRFLSTAPPVLSKTAGGTFLLPPASERENKAYYIIASANTTIGVQPGDKPLDGNPNVTNDAIFVSDGLVWHRVI